MKNIIKLISIILISLLFISTGYAERPNRGEGEDRSINQNRKPPSLEDRIERMKEKLELSNGQASSIKDVFLNAEQNCTEIDDRREFHRCMMEQREFINEGMQASLSPEQFDKFKEFKNKKMQKREKYRNK